jgi:hypothetical protein
MPLSSSNYLGGFEAQNPTRELFPMNFIPKRDAARLQGRSFESSE